MGVLGLRLSETIAGAGSPRRETRRAVTLLELLAVAVVISLLMALALPALSKARDSARTARSLATVSQIALAVTAYCAEQRDALPYCGVPNKPWRGLVVRGHQIDEPYFFQSFFYANMLVPEYLDRWPHMDLLPRDGLFNKYKDLGLERTYYLLTATAFAQPGYWDDPYDPDDLSQYRGQHACDCTFPSRKIIILNARFGVYTDQPLGPRTGYLSSTFDGAAAVRTWSPDLEANSAPRPIGAMPHVGMSTRFGIHGWDF